MDGHRWFGLAAAVAVAACYVTILIGGNVMASDSGLACPDWPTCHGTFTPPLSGGSGIEWAHRLSAVVLSATIAVLAILGLAFERGRPVLRRMALGAAGLVVAQALLGGAVVESDLVAGVVLLHLALATALFAVLLVLALLANLRDIPRAWVDFARRAAEELPPSEQLARARPGPAPGRSPEGTDAPVG